MALDTSFEIDWLKILIPGLSFVYRMVPAISIHRDCRDDIDFKIINKKMNIRLPTRYKSDKSHRT